MTFVHVTHNQSEALALADRVYVMNDGRIEQQGTPTEVYRYPATRFVADFVGRNNLIEGTLDGDLFRSTMATFPAGQGGKRLARGLHCRHPGRCHPYRHSAAHAASLPVRLDALEYAGSIVTWFLRGPAGPLAADVSADDSGELDPQIGETYEVWWKSDDVHYLRRRRERPQRRVEDRRACPRSDR